MPVLSGGDHLPSDGWSARRRKSVEAARELKAQTGYDELSLVSLSTTDHSQIVPIVEGLRREFGDDLTISLPSMRVDSFSVRISELVASKSKHNITFAPEAGTERLRMTINKIVTDEDLFAAVDNAFAQGWTSVKMYFMVGQPTETHEDIEGIVALAKRVKEIGARLPRRPRAGPGRARRTSFRRRTRRSSTRRRRARTSCARGTCTCATR